MEIYWSPEYVKMLIDESTEWTTYIGYANFDWEKAYKNSGDVTKPIWRIKKIVVDWDITEVFYPNWDTSCSFVWDDRDSLTYV